MSAKPMRLSFAPFAADTDGADGQFHILAAAGTGQVAFSDRIKRSKGPKATPSP